MAYIRTIKASFFTSDDIVSLSPLARLLYIALWTEADREGRFTWRPGNFKLRFLPGDSCEISELCNELVESGLVATYSVNGKTYAEIPTFKRHQFINNREGKSTLPSRVTDATGTRDDASVSRDNVTSTPLVGKERKGKASTAPSQAGESTPNPSTESVHGGQVAQKTGSNGKGGKDEF